MKFAGIYRIKNIITDDSYVGSSVNIHERWQEHRRQFKQNKHPNIHMQRAYNKYGVDAFKYEIFEICPQEYLLEREQERIESGNFKYNISLNASAPMIGRKHSDESKAKMRIAKAGTVPPDCTGRKHSEETKAKMSAAHKGKTNCIGHKNRLGQKLSEEHKARIRAARRAKKEEGIS